MEMSTEHEISPFLACIKGVIVLYFISAARTTSKDTSSWCGAIINAVGLLNPNNKTPQLPTYEEKKNTKKYT